MRVMSQISIDNYLGMVKPNLTPREQWVLEAIEELSPVSAEIVAEHLGVFPNVISGRFTGLKKKGAIEKAYEHVNSRGSKVVFYRPAKLEREYADVD